VDKQTLPKLVRSRTQTRQRGSGRPPASDGEKTKQRILSAARKCFGEYGYRETSNRIVAEEALLTPGTIYHYFDNKRDMFLSVQEETQKEILNIVLPAVAPAKSFAEAMTSLLDAFRFLYEKHPEFGKFNAVVRTEARRNPEIAAAIADQEWRHLYHRMSELGVATGEIDHRDARTLRNILSTIVLGVTQHGLEASNADHLDSLTGFQRLFGGKLVKAASRSVRAVK